MAAQGPQLEIQLQAPLESVLGFEHAPRSDAQRQAARAMAARLRQAASLFVPTPEAGCAVASVRLAASALSPELLGEPVAPPGSQAAADPGHSDLDATFLFRCAAPDRLRGLESHLQKAFPGIRTLKVGVVSGRGQKSVVLSRGRTSIPW